MTVSGRKVFSIETNELPGPSVQRFSGPVDRGIPPSQRFFRLELGRRGLTELRRAHEADAIVRTKLLADQDIVLRYENSRTFLVIFADLCIRSPGLRHHQ